MTDELRRSNYRYYTPSEHQVGNQYYPLACILPLSTITIEKDKFS